MTAQSLWHKELQDRRKEVWKILKAAGCDIVLVFNRKDRPESFRYLTNFTPIMGDMWGIGAGPEDLTCILNFTWELKEAAQVSGINEWYGYIDPYPFLIDRLTALKPGCIGVLGLQDLPWRMHSWLKNTFRARLEPIDEQLEFLRRNKSPFELSLLRQAVLVTDMAIDAIRPIIQPGVTETQIMAEILYTFHRNGCESSFFPVVIGGVDPDSAVIARKPRSRPLDYRDTLMIDIGASFQGYQADVSRTFVLGKPGPQQQHVWDTVSRAYDEVIRMCRPGNPCQLLHQTAQKIVEDAGYRLSHRLGHGFGLSTSYEWPSLDIETSDLRPGMTLAIEPAIYRNGTGAMKMEDCVLVTDSGCEILSKTPCTLDPLGA
jgi:Xaa-Pro aminopeptidase